MTIEEFDFSGDLESWLSVLPDYQRDTVALMLDRATPEEAAAEWLNASGPSNTAPLGALHQSTKLFYINVLREVHVFLCDGDRYDGERKQLLSSAQIGKSTLIAGIASAVSPHIGAAAVLLGPPIALTFAIVGRAGRQATCAGLSSKIHELEASDAATSDEQPP